ncbi:MAG: hypothetical protein DYG89_48990 [Caldilinea sp. CFX5]|nr:hypothetical protein [Caldilinea sp. CFX5]
MIVIYKKGANELVGVATKVFDNGQWREPTIEELYPNADHTEWGYLYVTDSLKYAANMEGWQFKLDDQGAPIGLEKKAPPLRIKLTTDAPDTDGDGLPEVVADGQSKATITAELRDIHGKVVPQTIPFTFRTTGGALSSRKVTAIAGRALVELTAALETVSVTVRATAEGAEEGSLVLEFIPRP